MKITPVTKNGKAQWRVSYNLQGKQHRYFFDDEQEAINFGDQKEQEKRETGTFWLDLSKADRIKAIAAIEKAKEYGFDLLEAVEFFSTHGTSVEEQVLVSEAIKQCLESKRRQGVSKRYQNELNYTLRTFEKQFGARMVNSIKAREVEAWLNNGHGWSPNTKRGYRVDVQTLFSYCEKHEYVAKNPVKAVPVPMVDYKKPGILSVKQAQTLMDAAKRVDPSLCGYLSLGIFAGIRPSELLRLTNEAVDLEDKHVEITQGKNRRQRRIVQLTDNCVAWCKVGMDLPPNDWQGRMEKVREEAGLLKDWPHDAMRHSYCTYALPILGSAATALNAGHSEAILFKHYAERVKKKVAEAFFAISPEDPEEHANPSPSKKSDGKKPQADGRA